MGKISNAINHYLSDNRRFADFFNGICFQGETVVRAEDLSEVSQVYYGMAHEPERTGQSKKTKGRKERTRDICKKLKSGGTLRILAVENQEKIDYTMPYRCMEYDVMEYGKQIDILRKRNRQGKHPNNITEKIGGVKKEDRLAPVYTICLYHGVETWDGPRTLGDMMDFGDEEEYDMCQAIREWAEEERSIGRMEGQQAGADEKARTIVKNMLMRGMSDADIMAIAECDQEFIDKARLNV